jgi:hypothetical protein
VALASLAILLGVGLLPVKVSPGGAFRGEPLDHRHDTIGLLVFGDSRLVGAPGLPADVDQRRTRGGQLSRVLHEPVWAAGARVGEGVGARVDDAHQQRFADPRRPSSHSGDLSGTRDGIAVRVPDLAQ